MVEKKPKLVEFISKDSVNYVLREVFDGESEFEKISSGRNWS